jgi:hypothetical protein
MIGGISTRRSRVLHCAWSLPTARRNPAPPRRQRSCCTESAWHELRQSKSGAEEVPAHLHVSFMWHTHPLACSSHCDTKWLHVHAPPLHAALWTFSCEPVVEVSICCAQQKLICPALQGPQAASSRLTAKTRRRRLSSKHS